MWPVSNAQEVSTRNAPHSAQGTVSPASAPVRAQMAFLYLTFFDRGLVAPVAVPGPMASVTPKFVLGNFEPESATDVVVSALDFDRVPILSMSDSAPQIASSLRSSRAVRLMGTESLLEILRIDVPDTGHLPNRDSHLSDVHRTFAVRCSPVPFVPVDGSARLLAVPLDRGLQRGLVLGHLLSQAACRRDLSD